MIDKILSIIHPGVKKDWDLFYPGNEEAIAKFILHSNDFPCYCNPIDRHIHVGYLHRVPSKYSNVKIKDLLPIAPYRLMRYLLSQKQLIIEAFKREEEYKKVVRLLDDCPHGVTLVCKKHMKFRLAGGHELPMVEDILYGLNEESTTDYLKRLVDSSLLRSNPRFINEHSKRGARTKEDVYRVKNADVVEYGELDMLFQELYPYCSEIEAEEKRIVALLHDEEIREKFKKKIAKDEKRNRYFSDFILSENRGEDSEIQKQEYCLSHLKKLDNFISRRLKEEVDAIAKSWPLGYRWYEETNSDPDCGDLLKGDDFLYDCIKHKDLIIKKDETISHYQELVSKYPVGVEAYNNAHKKFDDNLCKYILPSYEEVICVDEATFVEYQNNAQLISFHNNWLQSQDGFSSCCLNLRKEVLSSWGCYRYCIPFHTITLDGKKACKDYYFWQMFPQSYCNDKTLDYSNNQSVKEKADHLFEFVKKTRYFKTVLYDTLLSFIKELYSQYGDELVVLFGTSGLSDYETFNDFHFKYLKQKLSALNIPLRDLGKEPRVITDKARYIIIEVISENQQMKETCQKVLDLKHTCHTTCTKPISQECFSDIIYISLNKGFDSEEMQKIIDKTKHEIAQQKEQEEKQREEERKRLEAEQKRREELLKIKSILLTAVSSWDTLVGSLHYSYLFYYYPTTCEFEATEEEWANRWIVWNFKNTPGKTSVSAHQEALRRAIPMVKNKLLNTFDADKLKYLTLVCIPASSQSKTQARYEEFSNRICSELGIINAYPHITVVSEKEEKHLGGTGLDTSNLHFDEDFFKGKYVLLFDDIITKGNSMWTFKRKMESLGATVIGGLSLGKTKHERPVQGSIPQPFSRPVSPPQPTHEDIDDLPF